MYIAPFIGDPRKPSSFNRCRVLNSKETCANTSHLYLPLAFSEQTAHSDSPVTGSTQSAPFSTTITQCTKMCTSTSSLLRSTCYFGRTIHSVSVVKAAQLLLLFKNLQNIHRYSLPAFFTTTAHDIYTQRNRDSQRPEGWRSPLRFGPFGSLSLSTTTARRAWKNVQCSEPIPQSLEVCWTWAVLITKCNQFYTVLKPLPFIAQVAVVTSEGTHVKDELVKFCSASSAAATIKWQVLQPLQPASSGSKVFQRPLLKCRVKYFFTISE